MNKDVLSLRELSREDLHDLMGEDFYQWASSYFAAPDVFDRRTPLLDFIRSFREFHPCSEGPSVVRFRARLVAFCMSRKYVFNPRLFSRSGAPLWKDDSGAPIIWDKEGGVEYFTVTRPMVSPLPASVNIGGPGHE
jgi:hypothetical protein